MNSSKAVGCLSLALIVCSTFFPMRGRAESPATQPATEQQMQSWWEDLAASDPKMSRVLLSFSDHPEEAIAFFKTKLVPLILSEDDLNKLIADLGSDDEAVWKAAFDKLRYFDPRLAKDLNTLMSQVIEPAARNHLVEVLSNSRQGLYDGKGIELVPAGEGKYNFQIRTPRSVEMWPVDAEVAELNSDNERKREWTRAVRAIVLLEHIGTPDAIAILKDMATGHPDAQPTKVAREALATLGVPN